MENALSFFSEFLTAEANAHNAARLPNIEDYYDKLDQLNQFLTSELRNGLGLLPKTKAEDESYYALFANSQPLKPRYLFRIDQYQHPALGEIYNGITATIGGRMKMRYGASVWASIEDGIWKIFASNVWNLESKGWDRGPGMRDFDVQSLGKPVNVMKILSPQDDEESTRQYLEG